MGPSFLKTKIAKNIFSLSILQVANYLAPLITIFYLTRVLGPANYGKMAFALAFTQYFVVFSNYGFNLSATQKISVSRDSAEEISRYFSTTIVVKLGLAAIGFAAVLLCIHLFPPLNRSTLLFIASYILVLGNVIFPVWLLQGLERMAAMVAFMFAGRIITIILIFVFVTHRSDVTLAASLQSSAYFIAGILSLPYVFLKLRIRFSMPSINLILKTLSDGWHLFISTAFVSLYTSGSVFILGIICSPQIVGYFSAAQKIILAAQQVIAPITQGVFPHLASVASQSKEKAIRFISLLIRRQGFLTILVSITVFITAPLLVRVTVGQMYEPSISLIRIMAPLPFIIGLSNVLGIQTMLNFGMTRRFSQIIFVSGILNVMLVILLGKQAGATGAAVAVLITESVISLLMGISLLRNGVLKEIVWGGR